MMVLLLLLLLLLLKVMTVHDVVRFLHEDVARLLQYGRDEQVLVQRNTPTADARLGDLRQRDADQPLRFGHCFDFGRRCCCCWWAAAGGMNSNFRLVFRFDRSVPCTCVREKNHREKRRSPSTFERNSVPFLTLNRARTHDARFSTSF
uniref:Putative secreted protein n=1 Tax=Anopheles darlingi TaxID=43151 RepID=A0A2M4D9E9_ANODA